MLKSVCKQHLGHGLNMRDKKYRRHDNDYTTIQRITLLPVVGVGAAVDVQLPVSSTTTTTMEDGCHAAFAL